MRVYIPIDLEQLGNDSALEPTIVYAPTPVWLARNELTELEHEDAEEIALYTAAYSAWLENAPIRIAAAADVSPTKLKELPDGRLELLQPVKWDKVVSFHCDTPEMLPICSAAHSDEALAEELATTALSWFDVSERQLLKGLFSSEEKSNI